MVEVDGYLIVKDKICLISPIGEDRMGEQYYFEVSLENGKSVIVRRKDENEITEIREKLKSEMSDDVIEHTKDVLDEMFKSAVDEFKDVKDVFSKTNIGSIFTKMKNKGE